MSYIVFARKYRPRDFDEVVGQEHITTTLKNAIRQDRVAHAYIFSGPRGIGKTTTARILAKSLNCEKGPAPNPCNKCISCQEISSGISMDVIEIDGASNRGIDEVRQLRENVKFAPAHGLYKMYIIDEVHMLTPEAFNALLKTLEEPPPHVKFIFATTQPNKVLATILSRCQRFDFKRIATKDIVAKLKEIIDIEAIKIDEAALVSIARHAEGSLRDAETILDQLSTFCNGQIKNDDIAHILGSVSERTLEDLVRIIIRKDAPGALKFIDNLIYEGKDLSFFLLNLIEYFRNLMVARLCKDPQGLIELSREEIERLIDQSKEFSEEELFYISNVLINAYESARRAPQPRIILELALTKIIKRQSIASLTELLDRIKDIEKRIETKTTGLSIRHIEDEKKPPEERNETTANDIEVSHIQEIWPMFLQSVKAKKMSAASYLLEGSAVSLREGLLTIGFPKNCLLHKEALEARDNKQLIEEAFGEILQKAIRINFAVQDSYKEEAGADYTGKDKVREREDVEPEILTEPAVQSVLEIFDGRIIKSRKP